MDEAVGKVEVELAVEGHPEGGQDEQGQVPRRGQRLLVGQEGDLPGGAAVDKDGLPHRELGCKSIDILGFRVGFRDKHRGNFSIGEL